MASADSSDTCTRVFNRDKLFQISFPSELQSTALNVSTKIFSTVKILKNIPT